MIIQPWKLEPEHYQYEYSSYINRIGDRRMWLHGIALCVKETVSDHKTLYKKGDILKIDSGFYERKFSDWKEWFLRCRKDKEKYWTKRPNIPNYARNQYAMLMSGYKVTKQKYSTFVDYGNHIMFISGSNPGKLKRYYANSPFKHISSFPYTNIPSRAKKLLLNLEVIDLAKKLYQKYGNTEETRILFIEAVQNKINERS